MAFRGQRWIVEAVQRDEDRRIGHPHTIIDQCLERAVPVVTEVDVVMAGVIGRRALHAGHPQQTRRRVLAGPSSARRTDTGEQFVVRDREVDVADHGIGGDSFGTGDLHTGDRSPGLAQDARDRR